MSMLVKTLWVAAAALGLKRPREGQYGIDCTGNQLPAGQCWSDPGNRLGSQNGTTAAACCAFCNATTQCAVWVLWGTPGKSLACSIYSAAAPTEPCLRPPALTLVGGAPLPPPPPPPLPPVPPPPGAKDVILVAIDDMRPELQGSAYGCAHMKTPHFDAFASEAVVFDHAYVAVAWCSPSRTALLTSRRPDSSRTWSVVPSEYWRERGGNFTTLPQTFLEHGYNTIGVGKIFHPGPASGNNDVAFSWSSSALPYDGTGETCPSGGKFTSVGRSRSKLNSSMSSAMTPGENADTALASCANATFTRLAAQRESGADTRPFFFAVGFHKPHIPWTVPIQWYDLYPLDKVELATNRFPPEGVPNVALNDILSGYWANDFTEFNTLRANTSISSNNPYDNSTLPDYWARRVRQAYWAATSFTDDNFGQVVSAAKATGVYENAVTVVFGDHGYQLGDNSQWSKVTNFEQATRIPFMIRAPHAKRAGRSGTFFEAVDLLPTTVELAMGLYVPACPRSIQQARSTWFCTDGTSWAAAVLDVESLAVVANGSAYSQVPRGNLTFGEPGDVAGEAYMGYTLRQPGWRYTEWVAFDPELGKGNWSDVVGVELYTHSNLIPGQPPSCDFATEAVNVASNLSYSHVRVTMAAQLRAQFDIQN